MPQTKKMWNDHRKDTESVAKKNGWGREEEYGGRSSRARYILRCD